VKLTEQEEQVIRDLRAMTAEAAVAWRRMGGMLAGRISVESDEGGKAEPAAATDEGELVIRKTQRRVGRYPQQNYYI
jgi:hypothetical protein